jgi:hypothetical protein
MPVDTLQFGDGTLLEVNDGASNAFAEIKILSDITPPGASVPKIERKRISAVGYKEQVASPRKDLGEAGFTYEMTDVLQVRLVALLGVSKSYRITYPDGLRMAFSGFLSKAQPKQVQPEQISMGDGTIVLTSAITLSDETA